MTKLVRGRQKVNSREILVPRDRVDTDHLKRILRQMNLKITEQRLAILNHLTRGHAHVTVEEIFGKVKKNHPEVGFATVYRMLKNLAEKGYVTEVRMGGLPARYELTPKSHHDHLTCTVCGVIVEFENPDIEDLQIMVAQNHGFQLTGHVLELYGACGKCQKGSAIGEANRV